MRIAVSGTHCTGKSTLVDDFLARHGDYVHVPEPYEWLDDFADDPDADAFLRQLEICTERLSEYPPGASVIAERAPIDFLAYLLALNARIATSAIELAASGMQHIDLLIVLPADEIAAPDDENPALRESMDAHLFDLLATDRFDLLGGTRVVEIRGTRAQRLAALERAIVRN